MLLLDSWRTFGTRRSPLFWLHCCFSLLLITSVLGCNIVASLHAKKGKLAEKSIRWLKYHFIWVQSYWWFLLISFTALWFGFLACVLYIHYTITFFFWVFLIQLTSFDYFTSVVLCHSPFFFVFIPLEHFPGKGHQGSAASRVQRVWRY